MATGPSRGSQLQDDPPAIFGSAWDYEAQEYMPAGWRVRGQMMATAIADYAPDPSQLVQVRFRQDRDVTLRDLIVAVRAFVAVRR